MVVVLVAIYMMHMLIWSYWPSVFDLSDNPVFMPAKELSVGVWLNFNNSCQLSISVVFSADRLWSDVINISKLSPSVVVNFANSNKENLV